MKFLSMIASAAAVGVRHQAELDGSGSVSMSETTSVHQQVLNRMQALQKEMNDISETFANSLEVSDTTSELLKHYDAETVADWTAKAEKQGCGCIPCCENCPNCKVKCC